MSRLLRLLRIIPRALEREHLKWARAEMTRRNPCHPDLPYVIHRIRELENQPCR